LIDHNDKNKFSLKVREKYTCLENHKLFPIAQAIWEIVGEKSIFQNSKFKNILQFLEKFDQIDNNSTAFRYNVTKDGKPQEMHDEQWWIDIFPLFNSIKEMCFEINAYSNSEDFENDSIGQYEDNYLSDVEDKHKYFEE